MKKIISICLIFVLSLSFIPSPISAKKKPAKGSVFTYTLDGASVWLVKDMNGLKKGQKGVIVTTKDGYFKVKISNKTKWVNNEYCMIDLADVETGIDYKITNSFSSVFKSSGKNISGVTGKKITHYRNGKTYNKRLGKKEYVVPLLYPTAKKVKKAKDKLKKQGYTLVIYDTYRPQSAQKYVNGKFSNLIKKNKKVRENINKYGFGESWFLAQNISSHGMGVALDCTIKNSKMSSAIHELSTKARLTNYPIATGSVKKSNFTNDNKKNKKLMALQDAFMDSGMKSLSSEWWHFQDGTATQGTMEKVYKAVKSKGLDFIAY